MSVLVEWFDTDQTVIYQVIREPFAWDEFHAQDKVVKTMIASVPHPVSLLVDVQEFSMRNAPNGVLTHVRSTMPTLPANLTRVVVIADNLFAISLMKMAQRLALLGPNRRIHAVSSLDDAQAYLKAARL
jgi:hypothetical protein